MLKVLFYFAKQLMKQKCHLIVFCEAIVLKYNGDKKPKKLTC